MLIAQLGGWARLARSFEVQGPVSGDHFKLASARIGRFTGYNNCLRIIVSSSGVYLRPLLPFRAGHAPLYIPWDAVLELKQTDIWLFSSVKLAVQDADGGASTILTLYGRGLVDSVLKHAPYHLQDEGMR